LTVGDHPSELLYSLCAIYHGTAPYKVRIAPRISRERNYVIAVCYAATLVMDKPVVVLHSRKHEASPR